MSGEQRAGLICGICGSTAEPARTIRLLARHDVQFHACPACGFLFSEDPWWLHEAYSETVNRMDTGSARRSVDMHRRLLPVLRRLFGDGPFVDWAGGTGLFVRLMRDSGLDFYWQDAYATNVYAGGFEWDGSRDALAVTAIEVFEHLPSPVEFVDEVLSLTGADSIVFTQELHDGSPDPDWWYFAPETGQHIAFYTRRSLEHLGERFGMQLLSAGSLHLLTRNQAAARGFKREVRMAPLLHRLVRRQLGSLTERDAARGAARIRGE